MDYIYSSTNGSAQLPALPTWDTATHPLGVIVHCYGADAQAFYGAEYFFAVGTSAGQSGRFVLRGCGGFWIPGDGVWTYKSGYVGQTVQLSYDGWQLPIWTNKDIYYTDGTLYLAATAPVEPGGDPVEPDEPDAPGINFAQLRRAYINGLITGLNLRGNLRKKVTASTEAPAYLYGTPAEVNTAVTYNGVELPKLPEHDNATYPYAHIRYIRSGSNFNLAYLIIAAELKFERSAWGTNDIVVAPIGSLSYSITWYDDDGVPADWEELPITSEPTNTIATQITWANTAIYTSVGELLLAASEPVYVQKGANLAVQYDEAYIPYKGVVAAPLPTVLEHNTNNIEFPYIYVVWNPITAEVKVCYFQYPLQKKTYHPGTSYSYDGLRPNSSLYPSYYVYEFNLNTSGEWKDPGGGLNGNPIYFSEIIHGTDSSHFGVDYILWANTDILDEGGEVYFAASEPLPVASLEPTNYIDGIAVYNNYQGVIGMDILAMVKKATPKVIDLTQYATGDSNFNAAVLSLFTVGGSTMDITDDGSFWADVSTDQLLRFIIDGTPFSLPFKVQVDGVTSIIDTGGAWPGESAQISFTFRMINADMQMDADISVVFSRTGDSRTRLSVQLKPTA